LFPWERCQKDQNSTNRLQLRMYTRTHARKHTSFWVQKEDCLALFSQCKNFKKNGTDRLSRNVGKELPRFAVS
jgi:hypothetical protein